VARLRTATERPREREAAVNLLQAMRQRTDLYHAPALEIERLLKGQPAPSSPVETPRVETPRVETPKVETPREERRRAPASDVPPGWYPDPSGRHELRWFDDDWTAWASDRGTVVDDPDF